MGAREGGPDDHKGATPIVLLDAGCAVGSFDVVPLPGSDHRALVAEIVLPR